MALKYVECDQCGQKAEIERVERLLEPDPARPGVRVVLIVVCPKCGQREQPEKRAKRIE